MPGLFKASQVVIPLVYYSLGFTP